MLFPKYCLVIILLFSIANPAGCCQNPDREQHRRGSGSRWFGALVEKVLSVKRDLVQSLPQDIDRQFPIWLQI